MSLKRWKVDAVVRDGRQARLEGKPYESCPLKGGPYSMRGFWESGWRAMDRELESPLVGTCATCKQEVHEAGAHLYKPGMTVKIHTVDDGIVLTGAREFDPVAFGINDGDDESP